MKKFLNALTSKRVILVLLFFINLAIFYLMSVFVGMIGYSIFSIVFALIAVFVIMSGDDEPIYKYMWVMAIMLLPIFGTALYLYLRNCRASRKKRKEFEEIRNESKKYIEQNQQEFEKLKQLDNGQANLVEYITNTTNMPVNMNTDLTYLNNGETYFKYLLNDLKKANKFILLQYYIIDKGQLWDSIVKILKQKVSEGVEVKVLYDDFGCMDKIKPKEFKKIREYGIDAMAFNKCKATINKYTQYRDHRKLCVIDGVIGYVGGINLADEYANLTDKYGYWKDTGVRLEGEAVWNLTVLFSNNWKLERKDFDLERYRVKFLKPSDSFVQVFGSSPLYREPIARNNYVNMINSAKHYIYITTPYLLLDSTTIDALKIASKSGVDVRIVMPGIPDKKFIWYMGRAHYKELVNAGIKIYEFSPGFVHAKMVVVDDVTACVGTINFDFRSLYLHFENAIMIYNDKSIMEIKKDILSVIDDSREVTKEVVKNRKWYEKLVANLFIFFAPLM